MTGSGVSAESGVAATEAARHRCGLASLTALAGPIAVLSKPFPNGLRVGYIRCADIRPVHTEGSGEIDEALVPFWKGPQTGKSRQSLRYHLPCERAMIPQAAENCGRIRAND
jgi:hypothetical protein